MTTTFPTYPNTTFNGTTIPNCTGVNVPVNTPINTYGGFTNGYSTLPTGTVSGIPTTPFNGSWSGAPASLNGSFTQPGYGQFPGGYPLGGYTGGTFGQFGTPFSYGSFNGPFGGFLPFNSPFAFGGTNFPTGMWNNGTSFNGFNAPFFGWGTTGWNSTPNFGGFTGQTGYGTWPLGISPQAFFQNSFQNSFQNWCSPSSGSTPWNSSPWSQTNGVFAPWNGFCGGSAPFFGFNGWNPGTVPFNYGTPFFNNFGGTPFGYGATPFFGPSINGMVPGGAIGSTGPIGCNGLVNGGIGLNREAA